MLRLELPLEAVYDGGGSDHDVLHMTQGAPPDEISPEPLCVYLRRIIFPPRVVEEGLVCDKPNWFAAREVRRFSPSRNK